MSESTEAQYVDEEYTGLVTQFDGADDEIVLAQFGFQAADAELAESARRELDVFLVGKDAPDTVERARVIGTRNREERISLLYWRDVSDYRAWWERDDVQSWWGGLSLEKAAPGVWREVLITSSGRHQYATGQTDPAGPARFLRLVPSTHFGYPGAYRDRFDDASFDDFASVIEKLPEPRAAESSGRRVSAVLPDNICFLRDGQTWDLCSPEELDIWTHQMDPVVDGWVSELRDNPVETGCINILDCIEQDEEGRDLERRSQLVSLLSLGHIEFAARTNPKHLKLMKAFGNMYANLPFDPRMNIWVEIHIPQPGSVHVEYVNCHGMTGFLPFFPAAVVS